MKKLKKSHKVTSGFQLFEFSSEAELDFHTFGVLTAFDIEKYLTEFLEDSYISKMKRVLVITGKGLVVKPLVLKLLKKDKHVEKFMSAGYFNGQGGAIEIYLKD